MTDEHTFRNVLALGFAVVFPFALYRRLKSQATGEPLDRSQEGLFMLATLRPAGFACWGGLFAYLLKPAWMAWSSMPLPDWVLLAGIGLFLAGAALLVWTLRSLGPNLTDTVVTRKAHTLVTKGPYRWVRHPFYDAVGLSVLANSIAAANWFLLVTGVLLMIMIVVRTRKEEELLLARFGDPYRVYIERTGRFLPVRPTRQMSAVDSAEQISGGRS